MATNHHRSRCCGGDPDSNPALRRAIQNARAVNMLKDKVQNAIDKALKLGDTRNEQIFYGLRRTWHRTDGRDRTDNHQQQERPERLHKCGGNLG